MVDESQTFYKIGGNKKCRVYIVQSLQSIEGRSMNFKGSSILGQLPGLSDGLNISGGERVEIQHDVAHHPET